MPLVQADLKDKLKTAFEDLQKEKTDSPAGTVIPPSATKIADAYHAYAKNAMAGPLTPDGLPGVASILEAAMTGQPLDAGLDTGCLAYWSPVMWKGPGFIPMNPTIPAGLSGLKADLTAAFKKLTADKASVSDAADEIAKILHTYTTKLQVTATTVPPASVVSTLPVT